jgi:hypothetical protein
MSAISDPIAGMGSIGMAGLAPGGDGLSAAAMMEPAVDEADRRFQRLNQFLRDEISAELSYRLTADRLAGTRDAPYVGLLRQMEEEHGLAAETLRVYIRDAGGEIDDASGSLGPWRPAARCAAGLFGASEAAGSALECLRTGELHNLESYAAFAAGTDDRETAQLLRNLLIPIQQRHVRVLNELLGQRYGA